VRAVAVDVGTPAVRPANATVAPLAWALASGAANVIFAGVLPAAAVSVRIVAVSCGVPVSTVTCSPAARPVMLATETVLSPAAEAALSVVLRAAAVRSAPSENVTLAFGTATVCWRRNV
jgi:hypothetical protein